MSDMHEKLIEARRPEDKELKAGDKVLLEMESSLGPRAVLLGYFYPFLLVLASLIITTSIGMDQGISAIISVGLLIPYYTLLYLFRNKMKKRFVFKIR
jgi:sigma-E factor negative regulatory protein RseC